MSLGAEHLGALRVAVFTGKGSFQFTPPTAFERSELARFLHATTLDFPFRCVVLGCLSSASCERGQPNQPPDLGCVQVAQLRDVLKGDPLSQQLEQRPADPDVGVVHRAFGAFA